MVAMKRCAAATGLFLTLTGWAGAACPLTKLASINVSFDGNQIVAAGSLDGHPVRFLLDTASANTFVLAPAAEELSLPVTNFRLGQDNAKVFLKPVGETAVGEMHIDTMVVKGVRMVVNGQRANFGSDKLVAVIGDSFLSQFDIEIDPQKNLVNFYQRQPDNCGEANLAYWTDSYNVAGIQSLKSAIAVKAKVNDEDMVAVIDSGTPFSTLTLRAAERVGVSSGSNGVERLESPSRLPTDFFSLSVEFGTSNIRPNVQQMGDAFGGTNPARPENIWIGNFKSFAMDQEVIQPVKLRFQRFPTPPTATGSRLDREVHSEDMLIGVDFLRSHHVLISYSQKKFYFSYAGGPPFQPGS